MFFKEVVDALSDEKHIRRKKWESHITLCYNKWREEFVKCVCGGFYSFSISKEDLKANDWEIVEE